MDSLKNRITKEYEELCVNKEKNAIDVWLIDNNIKHWKGKIKGPVKFLLDFFYFGNFEEKFHLKILK